ncbi:MAG: UvrB/UvrC motif-containing protein [Minisyncoccota bacterium]
MNSQAYKSTALPDSPGVYRFLGPKKEVLYVGKATSLKDRVKSYFAPDLIATRGPLLVKMVIEARAIDFTTTDSVLEALMLEAHEIKKFNPPYNSKDKDNKSFNTVVITDEDFPKILVVRARNLAHWSILSKDIKIKSFYGPFPHGGELKEALKIIRKILPFRDEKCKLGGKPCFNAQIGLCPGPCAGWISKTDYRKQIKRVELIFQGKKTELVKGLEKEMKALAKEREFEKAEKVKRTIFALEHIQDMALIKRDIERTKKEGVVRIEAYDVAHMSGKDAVGVMVVVEDGELVKSQYRKFKIKVDKNDDTNNLREILTRRFNHSEWDFPQVIVVDGGIAQINAAKKVVRDQDVKVMSVIKDEKHKARGILGDEDVKKDWEKSILLANVEAHRFAIGYHRRLRGKGFRI